MQQNKIEKVIFFYLYGRYPANQFLLHMKCTRSHTQYIYLHLETTRQNFLLITQIISFINSGSIKHMLCCGRCFLSIKELF